MQYFPNTMYVQNLEQEEKNFKVIRFWGKIIYYMSDTEYSYPRKRKSFPFDEVLGIPNDKSGICI